MPYLFFQNDVVNIKRMVKSSKRPMSIRSVLSHFAPAGRALHVYAGPRLPKAGPILPTQLTEMLYPSTKSRPITMKINQPKKMSKK